MFSGLYLSKIIILSSLLYYLLSSSFLYYSINIIDLQYIEYLQSSVILFSYLSPVLHPYNALSLFTDWWQISTVYQDIPLTNPSRYLYTYVP